MDLLDYVSLWVLLCWFSQVGVYPHRIFCQYIFFSFVVKVLRKFPSIKLCNICFILSCWFKTLEILLGGLCLILFFQRWSCLHIYSIPYVFLSVIDTLFRKWREWSLFLLLESGSCLVPTLTNEWQVIL